MKLQNTQTSTIAKILDRLERREKSYLRKQKRTNMSKISNKFIKETDDSLNNYPRAMFDYKRSNMILLNI